MFDLLSGNKLTFCLSAFKGELAQYDLDQGWFNDRLKDTSDPEWKVFSNHESSLVPWLIIHFVGSRFLKKNNVKVNFPRNSFLKIALAVRRTWDLLAFTYFLLQVAP